MMQCAVQFHSHQRRATYTSALTQCTMQTGYLLTNMEKSRPASSRCTAIMISMKWASPRKWLPSANPSGWGNLTLTATIKWSVKIICNRSIKVILQHCVFLTWLALLMGQVACLNMCSGSRRRKLRCQLVSRKKTWSRKFVLSTVMMWHRQSTLHLKAVISPTTILDVRSKFIWRSSWRFCKNTALLRKKSTHSLKTTFATTSSLQSSVALSLLRVLRKV